MSESPESRLAVLENQIEHVESDLSNTKDWLSSIDGKVDDIKSRLDKQNGAIPHMQDDIRDMFGSLNSLHDKLESIKEASTDTTFKTRILWGGVVSAALAVLGFVVNFIFGA